MQINDTDQKDKPAKSWHDVLTVHPAAEMFPLMSEYDPAGFKELVEDIKKNGLQVPIVLCAADHSVLDGRNRLDALEAAGVGPCCGSAELASGTYTEFDGDPYAYVISANIHRRHLTAELKRKLIADVLKATPEKSDRQIAEAVKASRSTVGAVRSKMEAKGDVSKLDTRTDARGRQQPAKKKTAKKKRRTPEDFQQDIAAKQAAVPAAPIKIDRDPVAPDEELALLREFAGWFVGERARVVYDPKDRAAWRMIFDRVKAILGRAP